MAAEPKTKPTKASVAAFLSSIENETRKKDAKAVDKIFREITGEKPVMWGSAIVGYGSYDAPSGAWPRTGFSPRKTNLVLYVGIGNMKNGEAVLKKLGKHKTGKGCLYLSKLAELDEKALRLIIAESWKRSAAY